MTKISDLIQQQALDASVYIPVIVWDGTKHVNRQAGHHLFTVPTTGSITGDHIANLARPFLVTASLGWNDTDGVAIERGAGGVLMPDSKLSLVAGAFLVPTDWIGAGTFSVQAVLSASATGDIYHQLDLNWGAIGEAWNVNNDSYSFAADGLTADRLQLECEMEKTFGASDYIQMLYARDATNAADTIGNVAYMVGFYVSYVGDR